MRCLEITINGEVRRVVGVDAGALFTTVSTGINDGGVPFPLKCLSQSVSLDNTRRQKWRDFAVANGDEIVIRVIEADTCDPPDVVSHGPPRKRDSLMLPYAIPPNEGAKPGWLFTIIFSIIGVVGGYFIAAFIGVVFLGDQGPLLTIFTIWPAIFIGSVVLGRRIDRRELHHT